MEKSGKTGSCHCTCMAGMGQSCNHVSAAMYGIEAAVDQLISINGLTNLSCTSTGSQWLLSQKGIQLIKIKDMNIGALNIEH